MKFSFLHLVTFRVGDARVSQRVSWMSVWSVGQTVCRSLLLNLFSLTSH